MTKDESSHHEIRNEENDTKLEETVKKSGTINITRDGGFFKNINDLFKNKKAVKEMEKFGEIMEQVIQKKPAS